LWDFTGGLDGANSWAGLVFDKAGNLYGTTRSGGKYGKFGAVFKLSPTKGGLWKETTLHSFKGGPSDGAGAFCTLIFGPAGSLYGATANGGNPACNGGCGVVFKLTPLAGGHWKETILHSFDGSDGWGPNRGSLALDAAGNLFGVTSLGGTSGLGVVFEIAH
jgi:hypothetical protein